MSALNILESRTYKVVYKMVHVIAKRYNLLAEVLSVIMTWDVFGNKNVLGMQWYKPWGELNKGSPDRK